MWIISKNGALAYEWMDEVLPEFSFENDLQRFCTDKQILPGTKPLAIVRQSSAGEDTGAPTCEGPPDRQCDPHKAPDTVLRKSGKFSGHVLWGYWLPASESHRHGGIHGDVHVF